MVDFCKTFSYTVVLLHRCSSTTMLALDNRFIRRWEESGICLNRCMNKRRGMVAVQTDTQSRARWRVLHWSSVSNFVCAMPACVLVWGDFIVSY